MLIPNFTTAVREMGMGKVGRVYSTETEFINVQFR
jgi:hypothetical protein